MRHGMLIRADIQIEGIPAMTLPAEAIVYSDQGDMVFIKEEGKFRPVSVETGISEGGITEIVNWKELEGKEIVLKGGVYLLSALRAE